MSSLDPSRPIRVLHVLGSLRRGGIETWLMNMLRLGDPRVEMDFMLQAAPGDSGAYEDEAIARGAHVSHFPPVSGLRKRLSVFGLASIGHPLRDVLIAGNYDVVHVHGSEFNGDAMAEAEAAGTAVRVAHCHSAALARGKGGPEMWLRKLRHVTTDRRRLFRSATHLVACSRDAGHLLAGDAWDRDERCHVVYCGVPMGGFMEASKTGSRKHYLEKYQLPVSAKVIGHVGSMGPTPIKNHEFLVDIFAAYARKNPDAYLFMAGDGPLRQAISKKVDHLGLTHRVRMPGVIDDVPAVMSLLFDVNVMPSLSEGFGMTVTEAAAAGLASVISDGLPKEVSDVLPGRTHRVALTAPLAEWVDAIDAAMGERELTTEGVKRISGTSLCLERSAEQLIEIYQDGLRRFRGKPSV